MKKLLTLLLSLFALAANATTYYIDFTTGNDATGNGSISTPWKTLYKATSTVTTPGDIIHVNAGTFLETLQCSLALGVSIEGVGVTSVIQSTFDDGDPFNFGAGLRLYSATPQNGNQHISGIKFDGRSTAQDFALDCKGRSNVSIHDCTFQNFFQAGVIMTGQSDNVFAPPVAFATGCSFYNNIMNNCSRCDGVTGFGNFMFGGMDGMQIYNNTITQNQRTAQTNGWPIKNWCDGYFKNCRIYNNTLTSQLMVAGKGNGQDGFWDFSIEIFDNNGGNEIDHNTMNGSLDANRNIRGASSYSFYIHHNTIGPVSTPAGFQSGIIMEFSTAGLIVDSNVIRNCSDALVFSLRNNSAVRGIRFTNNLCINMTGSGYQRAIGNYTDGTSTWTADSLYFYNNTIVGHATLAPFNGFAWLGCASMSHAYFKNNIINGFPDGVFVTNTPANWTTSTEVRYNNSYGNAYSNAFWTQFGGVNIPANCNTSNNQIGTNPLLSGVASLDTLLPGSPCIDAGQNVGYGDDLGYRQFGSPALLSIISSSPANLATGVLATVHPTITFSETLNGSTVNTTNIVVTQGVTVITGSWGTSTNVATFTPTSDLGYSLPYVITVGTSVLGGSGSGLLSPQTITFTTVSSPSNKIITQYLRAVRSTSQ